MLFNLPKLDGLKTELTLEGTALKLMEECGELAQAIAKGRGLNGETVVKSDKEIMEHVCEELVDVMQVCASMTYVLQDKHGISLDESIKKHNEKIIAKGYKLPDNK